MTNNNNHYTDLDIIGGRGQRSTNHCGNIKFREIVEQRYEEYNAIIGDQGRKVVQEEIVQQVANYGGRFLDKPDESGKRKVLSEKEAMHKVRQCFSDYKKRLVRSRKREQEQEEQKSRYNIKNGFAPGAIGSAKPYTPYEAPSSIVEEDVVHPERPAPKRQMSDGAMFKLFAEEFCDDESDSSNNDDDFDNDGHIKPIPLSTITSDNDSRIIQPNTTVSSASELSTAHPHHVHTVSLTSVDLADQEGDQSSSLRDTITSLPKPSSDIDRNETECSLDVNALEVYVEENCRRLSEMSLDVTTFRRPSIFSLGNSSRQLSQMSLDTTTPNSRRSSLLTFENNLMFSSQMSLDTADISVLDAVKEVSQHFGSEDGSDQE